MIRLIRVVLHWTGGGHFANATDRRAYHGIVNADRSRELGDYAPEANADIGDGRYAQHSGQFNTGAIGLAAAGMGGATERPFDPGRWPIRPSQIEELAAWTAEMCQTYDIEVTRDTVLLHSEVRPRFGRGRYKWDINWWLGQDGPQDPVEQGDRVRQMVAERLRPMLWVPPAPPAAASPSPRWPAWLRRLGRPA